MTKLSMSWEMAVDPVARSHRSFSPVLWRTNQKTTTSISWLMAKAVTLPTMIQSDWPKTARNCSSVTGEKEAAGTWMATKRTTKA